MAGVVQATPVMPGGGTTGGSTVQPAPWTGPSWAAGLHSKLHDFVKKALLKQLMVPGASVCDLFCGRGTDTSKWAQAEAGHYIGVDLSASALEDAREEWAQCGKPYPAYFCELDPCMPDLRARLEGHGLPADLVCCLGHLQDCFVNEDMVKSLLRNVAALLKPGGFFLGITPDSSTIWYKYQKAVEGAIKTGSLRVNGALPRVRSELYSISFEDDRFNFYGTKYQLRFADDGLPPQSQILVHFPSLIRLAEEVGLECVEIQNLFDFYEDFRNPFAEALRSSCGTLLDAKGRLPTQAHEILMLYTTFIFKKVDPHSPHAEVCAQPSGISEDLEASACNAKDPTVVRSRDSGFPTEITEPPSKKLKLEIPPGTGQKQDPQVSLDRPEGAGEHIEDGFTRGRYRSGQRIVQAAERQISQFCGVEVEKLSPIRVQCHEGTASNIKEPVQLAEVNMSTGNKIRNEMEQSFTGQNVSLRAMQKVNRVQSHHQQEFLDPATRSTTTDPKADSGEGKRLDYVKQLEPTGKRQRVEDLRGRKVTEEMTSENSESPLQKPVPESADIVLVGNEHLNQLNRRLVPSKIFGNSNRPELQIDGADPCSVAVSNVLNMKDADVPSQPDSMSKDLLKRTGSNSSAGPNEVRQDRSGENYCSKEPKVSSDPSLEEVGKASIGESTDTKAGEIGSTLVANEVSKKSGTRKRWDPIADAVANPVQEDGIDNGDGSKALLEEGTSARCESIISNTVTCAGKVGASKEDHDPPPVMSREEVGAQHISAEREQDMEQNEQQDVSKLENSRKEATGSGSKDQKVSQTGKLIDLTRRADREKGPSEPPGLFSSLSNCGRVSHRGGPWRSGKSTNYEESSQRGHGRSRKPRGQRQQQQQQQDVGASRRDEDNFSHQGRPGVSGSLHNEQRDTEVYRRPQVATFGYATGEGLAAAVAVATAAARSSLPPEPGYAFFTPSIYPLLPSRPHNMQEIQLAAGHPTSRVMSPSSGILGPGPRPPPPGFAMLHGPRPNREQAIVDQQGWQAHPLPQDGRLTGVRPVGRFHRDEWAGQQDSFRMRNQRGLTPKFDSRNSSLVVPTDEYGMSAQMGRSSLEALRSHGPADNWLEVNPSLPPNAL